MRAAPAVSCAKLCERRRTRAYRFSGGTPAFPAQWLYGLLRALPGESGFVVSVVCGKLAHPCPVGPICLPRDLTPTTEASGPHDFTVRFSIARPHVLDRSRAMRPALPSHRAPDAAASTASHPAFRNDRQRPFPGKGGESDKGDLPDWLSEILPDGLFCRSHGHHQGGANP